MNRSTRHPRPVACALPAVALRLLCGLGLGALAGTAEAAPLVQPLPGRTRWTPGHGERELAFRLTDAAGAPLTLSVTELQMRAAPGVEVAPLMAGAPGEYRTQLRWPTSVVDLGLAVRVWATPPAELALALDVAELEPPPSAPPPMPPPERSAPTPTSPAPAKPIRLTGAQATTPRVAFELGLAGSALVYQGVYGFGGVLEVGSRFRLPFGALGVTLRLGLEQQIQPEPAPFLLNLGLALRYVLARPRWPVSPYVGFWMQGMLQRTPDALGAIALQRSESGLVLGGLAGAQVRVGRGGIFTELGYRHTVYRQTVNEMPGWNTVFLLLGYRVHTN